MDNYNLLILQWEIRFKRTVTVVNKEGGSFRINIKLGSLKRLHFNSTKFIIGFSTACPLICSPAVYRALCSSRERGARGGDGE